MEHEFLQSTLFTINQAYPTYLVLGATFT